MKKQEISEEAKDLRLRAEDELKKRKLSHPVNDINNLKLIHELQVHQIELELQNEELVQAREQAEKASEKYVDLYDFAPSGLITLSSDGEIENLNFSAAKLLGKERIHLKNTRFGLYVMPISLVNFNNLFDDVFKLNVKITCELFLLTNSETPTCVQIDAIAPESNNECLITMIDITERKQLEDELKSTLNQLKNLNSYFLTRELKMIDLKKEINELLIKAGCEKEYLI
jgi:PAS domain-containing protein